jgi:hypothetical protein
MGLRLVLFVIGAVGAVVVTLNKIFWSGIARGFKTLWGKGRIGRCVALCLAVLLGMAYPVLVIVSTKTSRPEEYEHTKKVLSHVGELLLTKEIALNIHVSEVVLVLSVGLLTYAVMTVVTKDQQQNEVNLSHDMKSM